MKRKLDTSVEDSKVEKKSKADAHNEAENDQIFNFDIKAFRKKLKGHDFSDDLQFLVKNAEKSPQLISDFLELGGRPLEIVEAITKNEEKIEMLSNLFQMLQHVCSRIANEDQLKGDSIVQGLKFLVTKNASSINKMLASPQPVDKITAMKVLSIGVATNRDLGVEILKSVEIFTKASKEDLNEVLKATKQHDQIRVAYVEFFISFFCNDADAVLRKRILHNKNLFEFLLQNLHKDTAQTIERVLSVLTEKVLMSPDFNKVDKFKAFNDEVVKSLMKLYEWKENDSEKEHVQIISHYFLKLLLANKKYGIVFKSFSEKCKNLRQVEVIRIFKHFWMHEYPSKLVIEIIKACPDLIQIVLDRLIFGLQPRKTMEWFMCMNFTKNLLTALDPAVMTNFFILLQAKKVSANIIKLSIPHYILQNVNDNALIQQDSLEIRESSAGLLHLMLDRCCKYLDELRKLTNLKDFELHRIKFDVINHIFTFFPHIDIILNSLYRSINLSVRKQSDESEVLIKSQLKSTLEILLLLIERFPSTVEKIPSVVDYLEVLKPIYEFQLNADNMEDNNDLEIEMKVVKIILLLQPNILSNDPAMFNKIFLILIQVFSCSKNDSYRREAKLLVSKMLQSTQIFPACNSLEISIWLEALRLVKPDILKQTASKFIELIRSIKKSSSMQANSDIKSLNQNLLKTIDRAEESEEAGNSQLSPMLTSLLRMDAGKLNKIIDFAEMAFVLFYHSYPDLKKSFKSLLALESSDLCVRLLTYVKNDELSAFEGILPTYSSWVYRKFQQTIISNGKINIAAVNEDEQLFLLLQSVFCAIKLSEGEALADEKIDLLVDHIGILIKKLQSQERERTSLPEHDADAEANDRKTVNKIFTMNIESPLEIVTSHVFNCQSRLYKKFNVMDETSQITKFVVKMVETLGTGDNLQKSLTNYRQKVISQLKDGESNAENSSLITRVIKNFPFSDTEYAQIMEIVLKHSKSLDQLRYIMVLLKRLTMLKTTTLSTQQVHEIEHAYVSAVQNPAFDFNTEFCDAFHNYLSTFVHNIADTTVRLFELALKDELTVNRSFLKLLSTLFRYNDANNEFFTTNGLKLKKEILYPLLHIAFEKELVDAKMMMSLYQTFKSGIMRTIEKPSRAAQIYRENINSTIQLIEKGMPINECRDMSMKKFKFDTTEVYQLEMISSILMKAFEKDADKSATVFFNFISNYLQMFALAEKKMHSDFVRVLSKWIDVAPNGINWDKLDEGNWEYFYTTSLKLGLKSPENACMLVLLGKLVRILDIDANQIATIFDMIVTHSNFCELVFNLKSSGSEWKRDLFFLLNILVQKNPLIAHKKHIPIYFSSYQATMSSSDQLILNLLRFYELNCEIDFFEFRPFLFGTTALAHFSSLDQNELKISAKVDEVKKSYFKVINSFERATIANTMVNFPTKRKLANYGLSDLDQFLKASEEQEKKSSQVYDPVFYLPLFELLLGMNNFNFISLATRKNLFGLVPLGLSFEDENMRLMTAHILMKCRECVEGKKKKKELWIEFYESIQKGLSELKRFIPKGHKKGDKIAFPRVASVASQLLGEFFNILPDKLHCVHNIVANYVIVRDKYEFSTIPEFLVMCCSFELNQEEHRLFLLNAINNGIKDELDFKLLNNTPLIKMQLACYGSPLSTRKIDLLILKILDNLIIKTNAADFLVERYGLILWIHQACVGIEAFEYDSIDMIVSIIHHLQPNFVADAEKSKIIMSALVSLLEKFTKTKLAPSTFQKFLSTAIEIQSFIPTISTKHYELTLEIVDIFMTPELRQHLNYATRHPTVLDFANSDKMLPEALTCDESTKLMINQCKQFIKSFHSKKH